MFENWVLIFVPLLLFLVLLAQISHMYRASFQIQALKERVQGLEARLVEEMRFQFKNQSELSQKFQLERLEQMSKALEQLRETTVVQLDKSRQNMTEHLDKVRDTVQEKLDKTLGDRLGQSFDSVGKQLVEVQKGLGEMQSLATDVGGLKKVLSNVKMRGSLGEMQLSLLLDQILSPHQFEANVKTKSSSSQLVEFAIKLPQPQSDNEADFIWLPIDAKFPKDVFETFEAAVESGDTEAIGQAQKQLEQTVKSMAKSISEKYLQPPQTTDFGILFLPFENLFSEVIRRASLMEEIFRQHKVIVTGPTTLAAILSSVQWGLRSVSIQRRSQEVWKTLNQVKKEFDNFAGLLDRAQVHIRRGLDDLDDVVGKRTRAIQRSLSSVEMGEERSLLGPPDVQE